MSILFHIFAATTPRANVYVHLTSQAVNLKNDYLGGRRFDGEFQNLFSPVDPSGATIGHDGRKHNGPGIVYQDNFQAPQSIHKVRFSSF